MSYNLFITRKEFYIDEGDDIPVSELVACMDSEKGFEKISEDEYLWQENPNKHLGDVSFWIDKEGYIETKNPEQATICKMYEIAEKLQARVQGEDGEFYGEDGEVVSD